MVKPIKERFTIYAGLVLALVTLAIGLLLSGYDVKNRTLTKSTDREPQSLLEAIKNFPAESLWPLAVLCGIILVIEALIYLFTKKSCFD